MPDTIIIGDGPGGLSAALFLAKSQHDVLVLGDGKSVMHYAYLRNYLGIPAISGTDFQRVARDQVLAVGAALRAERVQGLAAAGERFAVTLESGEQLMCKYLVLSEGKAPKLAAQLGLAFDEARGIAADRNARTSVDRVYVVGRAARPGRSQAIISAGDGAAAAIDILSRERGRDVLDWDEPPGAP
jgi:thioredoxin reductase